MKYIFESMFNKLKNQKFVFQISPCSKSSLAIHVKLNILQEKLEENRNEYLLKTQKKNINKFLNGQVNDQVTEKRNQRLLYEDLKCTGVKGVTKPRIQKAGWETVLTKQDKRSYKTLFKNIRISDKEYNSLGKT